MWRLCSKEQIYGFVVIIPQLRTFTFGQCAIPHIHFRTICYPVFLFFGFSLLVKSFEFRNDF
jgi:hypothetical protein